MVTILFPTSLYFSLLPKICQVKDKTLCLINYADALFIVSTAVLASIIFFKQELQEQELKTWIEIYTKRKFYGLVDILRYKESKQITLRKRCESATVIFLLVAMVILHFAFSYDNLEWSFTRKCGIILCFGMLILNIFIWIQTEDYNFYAWSVIQLKTVATVVGIYLIR